MHQVIVIILTVCLCGFAVPRSGWAQDIIEPGSEKVSFVGGAFLTTFDANLRIDDPTLGKGTKFNLRDDVGVDRQQTGVWVGAEWRFTPKQRLGINYTRFTPSATKTLTHAIQIGNVVYPAGTALSTELHMDIVPITYSYSFIKRDSDEFAGTIGVNWNKMEFNANGVASLAGSSFAAATTANANFPLPLFGVRYRHDFSERWSVNMEGAGFVLKVAEGTFDVRGSLWNARVEGEYRFSRHFAAAAAVEAFSIDINANKTDWRGDIGYRIWGPQVYLKARF
jgi:hypothetical protein